MPFRSAWRMRRRGRTWLPAPHILVRSMSLSRLANQLKISYRSSCDDLVRDLFVPCLEGSTLYRRAVGYFTSAGLAQAARGVASLVSRGGKMRLVASPHLEEG